MGRNLLTLYKMPLTDNETYENWNSYLNYVIPASDQTDLYFEFKEPTSQFNPVVKVSAQLGDVIDFNYARIILDDSDENPHSRCYYVQDIVSVSLGVVEIHLEFDAIRSVNWLNSQSNVKLKYSTNPNHWSTTVDDTRFNPFAPIGNNIDTVGYTKQTGIPAHDTAEVSNSCGVYLVKWWWGYQDPSDPTDKIGVVCGMFNKKSFNYFVWAVNNFCANNWGSQLSGITDFTQFIISAKYFPSLYLNKENGHDSAPHMAGYYKTTEVGVGGLVTVAAGTDFPGFECWIKYECNAGFIASWFNDYSSPNDQYVPIVPFGGDFGYLNNFKKMKFLMTPKWSQMVVKTPVGIGSIDMSCFTYGDKLYYTSQIDLESGIMTMNFYRSALDGVTNAPGSDADIVLSLSAAVYYDVIGQFTRIQSDKEVIINSLTKGMVNSVASGLSTGQVGIAAIGGVASMPVNAIQDMMAGREINQPRSSNGNDLYWLHRQDDSLRDFQIKYTVFVNPDTPIYDPEDTASHNAWTGFALYDNYYDWCVLPFHGFPSIVYTDLNPNTILAAGTTWIQCAEVFDIQSVNGILMTPEIENQITNRLLHGILIHPGPIVT